MARFMPPGITAFLLSAVAAAMLGGVPAPAQADPITQPIAANDHSPAKGTYPEIARLLLEQGTTLVSFTIEKDGTVDKASVAKSSGWPRLDEAAVDLVGHWLYRPATQNGEPIAVTHETNIRWSLSGSLAVRYDTLIESADNYPPKARERHEEGFVLAMLRVDGAGNIETYELKRSSGFADLDAASQAILTQRSHVIPAGVDGNPFDTWIPIVLVWTLDPKEAAAN